MSSVIWLFKTDKSKPDLCQVHSKLAFESCVFLFIFGDKNELQHRKDKGEFRVQEEA